LKPLLLPIVLLGGLSLAASAAEPSATELDTIAQRVRACTPCHGAEGRATSEGYYPRIAGKPAGYLYNQLVNFRDGRRHFPMMTYLTERQTEQFLLEMAAHFAAQELPYPPPQRPNVDAALLERGRVLATEGDAQREIPACSACHGSRLMGVEPSVPGLLGLPDDYLIAQMGSWRSGSRRAHEPDCMAEIARRLEREDLAAVAAWLAVQPVPENTRPDPAFEQEPPMRCGSIPENTQAAP
jgi:Cytochrome c553